jgi:hypothetical protein
MILDFVVLRVGLTVSALFSFFIMSEVNSPDHSTLLEIPVDKLFAEAVVG